jgi:topoisomerase-4 subunit B
VVKKNNNYSAKDIEILEGLDPVRKRPGMYIGGTDETAYHHLATEIIDNSMDEVSAGHAKNIYVTLNKDKSLTVIDDGRGIPIDKHPKKNKTALEIVMTTLHAGGKFKEGSYSTSAGLHGVGLSVVNALSDKLKIEVFNNSNIFQQNYSKGKPLDKLIKKGKSKLKTGTKITFFPDKEIFGKEISFQPNKLYQLCKTKAYLVKGITIHWECDRSLINRKDDTPINAKLFFPDGIIEYLQSETRKNTIINDKVCHHKNKFEEDKGNFEFAVQWHNEASNFQTSFCNSVLTSNGGTHEQGFRSGISKSIRKIAKFKNNKIVQSASADDILSNASYIFSIFISNPEFEGQTKSRLSSSFIQKYCDNSVSKAIEEWFNQHPKAANSILEFIEGKIREKDLQNQNLDTGRQSATRKIRLPGKLADCSSSKIEGTELFIVEGDSAGGSAKQARDRNFQAILPLRGKILNVKNSNTAKILANTEISNLLQALGCQRREKYNDKDLRYEKIIIMTDADVDGDHIASLLLTFFFCEMPNLIKNGHLYLAVPPLYKLTISNQIYYVRNDIDKDKLLKNIKKGSKVEISRFKGLGEMMAQQLKETTMNINTRSLIRVNVPNTDFKKTNKLISNIMGKNSELRLKFIEENAPKVKNIDL